MAKFVKIDEAGFERLPARSRKFGPLPMRSRSISTAGTMKSNRSSQVE